MLLLKICINNSIHCVFWIFLSSSYQFISITCILNFSIENSFPIVNLSLIQWNRFKLFVTGIDRYQHNFWIGNRRWKVFIIISSERIDNKLLNFCTIWICKDNLSTLIHLPLLSMKKN